MKDFALSEDAQRGEVERKLAELALFQSEARFQELVRRSPVPQALYDAQGNILLINDRLTAVFGYTRDDIPHLSEFWPRAFPDPEARAEAQARWAAAVAEAERLGCPDIAPDEYLITCKDGTVRVTEAFGSRIGDSAFVVLNDVSARRQAEIQLEEYRSHLEELVDERTRELRIRQERLEVALEATSTGLWQWNPAIDGEITTSELYLSQTYYTMLGYEPGEFPADHAVLSSLIHPDDRSAVNQIFYGVATAADDISFNYEFRMLNKQGAWRWILAHGKIVGRDEQGRVSRVVGVDTDITERKDQEKRLKMAMQSLENTREYVSWVAEDGRILYANPAMERELGYTAEELQRMTVSDIDPTTPAELFGPDGELMRVMKARGLRRFETMHRHRDGHLIPVELASDGFDYEDGICFIAIARDISERLAAEEALRQSEARFSAIFSLTPEPMALTRLVDGVVLEVSRSYAEYFGYRSDELVGRSTLPADLGLWIDDKHRLLWQEKIECDGEVLGFETPLQRKDGSIATVLISGKVVDIGGEQCLIVSIRDITERKQHAEHLERIAHHDPLTGLPNRLLFGDRLRHAIAQNQRSATRIAVCFLDLDGFKQVNDQLGHQAGDELLVEVSKRLVAGVRSGDTVARLGGDEFVLLLSGLTCDDECQLALDRLLQVISAPYVIGEGIQAGVSASIGVTLFPNDAVDPDTLVRHADHAMYVAKHSGKNRCQLFNAL